MDMLKQYWDMAVAKFGLVTVVGVLAFLAGALIF